MEPKVTLVTLESRLHEVNSIRSGIKLYDAGAVEFGDHEDGTFWARVKDRLDTRGVMLEFSRDGCDLARHWCNCSIGSGGKSLCKHIVAAVLAIQGGIPETKLALGKTASLHIVVDESRTVAALKTGALPVFATPSMIALMELAACECLADCLDEGQACVGTVVDVRHTAASPLGAKITATATIKRVFGRRVEFAVTARDAVGEIGKGKHTRVIVDVPRFMEKAGARV